MSATHQSSSPIVHSVHFYDRDEALIQRLRSIVSSAIDNGNSALIVATQEHRRQLIAALEANGDPRGLEMGGRLTFLDADETLSLFMVDGLPDQRRFLASVGKLVRTAKRAAWNGHRGLTVFGEMVAIL
jgi:MEDS: MEthanogen/methylotroph, DcmR Sensory domain